MADDTKAGHKIQIALGVAMLVTVAGTWFSAWLAAPKSDAAWMPIWCALAVTVAGSVWWVAKTYILDVASEGNLDEYIDNRCEKMSESEFFDLLKFDVTVDVNYTGGNEPFKIDVQVRLCAPIPLADVMVRIENPCVQLINPGVGNSRHDIGRPLIFEFGKLAPVLAKQKVSIALDSDEKETLLKQKWGTLELSGKPSWRFGKKQSEKSSQSWKRHFAVEG